MEREDTHLEYELQGKRQKRETELYKMIEIAAKDEEQEDHERNIIKKTLQQLRKEEDEADGLYPAG